jgi:hypothetical protein
MTMVPDDAVRVVGGPDDPHRAVLIRADGSEFRYLVRETRRAARVDVSVLLALESEFRSGRVEPVDWEPVEAASENGDVEFLAAGAAW